jgi:Domain of unknown function (DUF6471)
MMTCLIVSSGNEFGGLEKTTYKGGMTKNPPEPKPGESNEKDWEEMAKNILRAEMMRRGVSYAGLAERLADYGVNDNELNLRNKVSRGRFTAVFLMQCLSALGVEWVQVPVSVEEAGRKGGAQALARRSSKPDQH